MSIWLVSYHRTTLEVSVFAVICTLIITTIIGVVLLKRFLDSKSYRNARIALVYTTAYSLTMNIGTWLAVDSSAAIFGLLLALTIISFGLAVFLFVGELVEDEEFRRNTGFGFLVGMS